MTGTGKTDKKFHTLQQEYEDWMNMQKLLCLKDPDTYPMRIVGFHIILEM